MAPAKSVSVADAVTSVAVPSFGPKVAKVTATSMVSVVVLTLSVLELPSRA